MTRPYWDRRQYKVHVIRRLAKIESAFDDLDSLDNSSRTLLVGALVLELDNLIIQAFRSYGIMSLREAQVAGRISLPGKRKYSLDGEYPSIVLEAMSKKPNFSKLKFKAQKRDEVAIRDPARLRTLLTVVVGGVSTDFANALALNCQVFSELRDIRHFYAHRCEDTFRRAMHQNPFFVRGVVRHPDDFVSARLPGHPEPKLRQWVSETEAFFSVAA